MALDRSAFEARLAANAVTADVELVYLPTSGDSVWMRTSVTRDMAQRAYAAAGGDEDQALVGMTNFLKFLLVDEDGKPLARSFAEARGWFTTLTDADALVVLDRLRAAVDRSSSSGDAETPKGS